MEKIGFGKQPYLVCRRHDATHPHIHIVSIKVRTDGSRIDMNNIGRNQSEQARKSIEKEFGLVNAEVQKKQEQHQLKPVAVSKALYGKSQTKMAIQMYWKQYLYSYIYFGDDQSKYTNEFTKAVFQILCSTEKKSQKELVSYPL